MEENKPNIDETSSVQNDSNPLEKKRLGRPRKSIVTDPENPELKKLHDAVDKSQSFASMNDDNSDDVSETTTQEAPPVVPQNDLLSPKVERSYSQGDRSNVAAEAEEIIPEPIINHSAPPPPVIPPSQSSGGSSSSSSSTFEPTPPTNSGSTNQPPPKQVNPNISNLTSKEKKSAIEKTADVIIENYAQLLPLLFKKIASVDMNKMKQLNLEGKLLWMLTLEDGNGGVITPKQFFERYNDKVAGLFVVTQQMKDDVRQPLIDVLMEKDIAMTPTQRLLAAVGGQAIMFAFQAFELKQEINGAIESFKLITVQFNNSGSPKPPPDMATPPDASSSASNTESASSNYSPEKPSDSDETVQFVETVKNKTSITMNEVLDENSPKVTIEHIPQEEN